MSDRNQLNVSQLPDLLAWAKRRGWRVEENKDKYDVLRLRRDRQCAIFHQKSPTRENITVWGESEKLTKEFLRSLPKPKTKEVAEQSA